VVVAIAVVGVAVVSAPGGGRGAPYDPRSADRDGAKGIVDTLRQLRVPVTIVAGVPSASDTAALLLVDQADQVTREQLAAWVEAGGTLVVADPGSPLIEPLRVVGEIGFIGGITPELRRNCDAFGDVIKPDGGVVFRRGVGTGCFTADGNPFVVIMDHGRGSVVALGGASPILNARLGTADNAALAVDLLAPTASSRVAVIQPPKPGGGSTGLLDLVPRRVKLAVWQLAIAFLVVVAWRARRVGRPVVEPQLVAIPGSELVGAMGHLLQRSRRRGRAAEWLRRDARRAMAERLGLPPSIDIEPLATAAAVRAGRPVDEVRAWLSDEDPEDEAALVELARSLESLQTEVASAP
jgi:hypothetical protein